jgi:short subunit dehydrogenase-like uncharacterized protein
MLVFPGGGYQALAIDLEGTEVCDWLTSRGLTAVLLKYRVPTTTSGPYSESHLALEDACAKNIGFSAVSRRRMAY